MVRMDIGDIKRYVCAYTMKGIISDMLMKNSFVKQERT